MTSVAPYKHHSIGAEPTDNVSVVQEYSTGAFVAVSGNKIYSSGQSRQTIGCLGDSIFVYYNILSGTASALVNNQNGTATIQFSSNLGIQAGDLIGITGAGDPGFHVIETPCLSVTGSGPFFYTYALSGTPQTIVDSGGTPAIVYRFRKFQAGPAAWAQVLLRQDAEYVNLGQGGDTFERLNERFDRDVPTRNLNRLMIHCGINDIFSSNLTLAQVQANATTLFAKASRLGIPVDILTPVPQSSSRGGWTAAKRDIFRNFRNWLIQIAPTLGFGLIDTWSAAAGSTNVLNVTDANLNPNTNVLFDFVHPSNIGAQAIGAKIAAAHRTFVPRLDRLTTNTADGNLLSGGTFQGAGGSNTTPGGTGTVATGWTVSNTAGTPSAACSVVARSVSADGDLIGNNQRMAITFGANNDVVRLASASIHSSLTNGDQFRVSCAVTLSATGAQFVKGLQLYVLSQTATTGNLQFFDLAQTSAAGFASPDGFSGVFELDCYVRTPASVNGAPTSVVCYIEVVGAAAGTSTVDVGRFTATLLI